MAKTQFVAAKEVCETASMAFISLLDSVGRMYIVSLYIADPSENQRVLAEEGMGSL